MAHNWGAGWRYQANYSRFGVEPVPQRIGFNVNTQILTKANYASWCDLVKSSDYVSIDTETDSLRFDEANLICISVGCPDNRNVVGFWYTDFIKKESQPLLAIRDQLKEFIKLVIRKNPCFYWNRLFDQRVLINSHNNPDHYLTPEDFHTGVDGLHLWWLMDTNVKEGLSLKPMSTNYLGIETSSFEDNVGESIYTADPKMLAAYAGRDAYGTLELGIKAYRIWAKHCPNAVALDRELDNALFTLLQQPVATNLPPLKELETELAKIIEGTVDEFTQNYGLINLGSSQQKADLLQSLGYSTGKFTPGGKMSVDKAALQALADAGCDPARLMIKYSKFKTLQNNFVSKMVDHLDKKLPVRFNLYSARVPSLRFAAGSYKINRKPYDYFSPINSQALAKPSHIMRELDFDLQTKEIYFPESRPGEYYVEAGTSQYNSRCWIGGQPGRTIVETDYHTLEAIVPMNLSHESVWIRAVQNGEDLHKNTAALVFGVPPSEVTPQQRQMAKKITFGCMYAYYDPTDTTGLEFVMINRCGVSPQVAHEVAPKYVAALPSLYAWKKSVYDRAVRGENVLIDWGVLKGFTYTVENYLKSGIPSMVKYGKKLAVNCCGQGAGGIFGRMFMIALYRILYAPGGSWTDRYVINPYTNEREKAVMYVNQVHDSLVCSVANEVLDEWIPVQVDLMERVSPQGWEVPLEADPAIGFNWGEVFPVVKRDDGIWVPDSQPQKRPHAADSSDAFAAGVAAIVQSAQSVQSGVLDSLADALESDEFDPFSLSEDF